MRMETELDDALLKRLEGAFHRDVSPGVDVTRGRVLACITQLAQALEREPCLDVEIPDETTGVRRRYLEALKANIVAKQRHAQVLTQIQRSRSSPNGDAQVTNILSSRLDQLLRQKQHTDLEIINHHSIELDKLSNAPLSSRIVAQGDQEPSRDYSPSLNIDQIIEDVRDGLRALELAVVQARHKASREQLRLQSAQTAIQSYDKVAAIDQLQALSTVRMELTTWLEKTLATCSSEDMPNGDTSAPQEGERNLPPTTVQKAYHSYIEARKRLLDATQNVTAREQPSIAIAESFDSSSMNSMPVDPINDQLMECEQNLGSVQSKQSLRQADSYLEHVLREEKANAVDLLQRLADESQLLPAYPILARSENSNNAITAFGCKVEQVAEQITDQTEAWSFATSAASESIDLAVTKHLESGNGAMEEVQKNLRDLSFLRDVSAGTLSFVQQGDDTPK